MMSGPAKKQRHKKSNERIIPIQVEGRDFTTDDKLKSTDLTKSTTTTIDSIVISGSPTSDDASEDNSVCSSVGKLEISDNVESQVIKDQEVIKIPARKLPPYNVPEKIIIILDRAEDEVSTCFELNNGNKLKPLDMLKDSVKFFLNMKNSFDNKHEFALITLNENSASWIHDFTNNIQSIIQKLKEIEECETEDIFDLGTVFDLINKNIKVPTQNSDLVIPPPFVVRALFLYNRSITMPEIELTDEISELLHSPYFTFDVAMTHEIPDSSNKCNLIFKELQQLDTKGFAYFFPISRSAALLYAAIAKLLSHPLQRCTQKDANYKINSN
ncbi:hypothetical protein MML48_7g00007146 [Holotrichia oblita]|uniref:Uncharacterized protein n=1 Tax=Holotrichia oblita TaxID=644536 RepID=A0ACB9SSQ4_HOLOL|nr:hypothetical protein MML48_7g00007146 [Holotrichia oblita]